MTREILDQFQGKENVTKIISDNGTTSYLTQSRSFAEEADALGACKINTIENDKKHILFLFNCKDDEVGRYYLGKSLQGKTPSELVAIKDDLYFLESWSPEKKTWVPCVGLSVNKSKPTFQSKSSPTGNSTSSNIKQKYIYTEEDLKREIAEQEEKNLLEYGTTDEKEIERIKKEKKEKTKFYIILLILVFIVPILLMGMIQKCTGSNYNPLEDNTPWEPRHTQIYNPVHNANHEITTESSCSYVSENEKYRVNKHAFLCLI